MSRDHGRSEGPQREGVPLWLKIAWTAFVAVLIPVWVVEHGPANFLWFSDIALFGLVVALWLEHRLIASMMALATLLTEAAWTVDYLAALLLGWHPVGLTEYMFDPAIPLHVRAMSLFHVPMLVSLIWLVWRLGYDRAALLAQTLLAWVVLPLSYVLSGPEENINWVYGFGERQEFMHPLAYLALLMLLFPLVIYVPAHFLLAWLSDRRKAVRSGAGGAG